MAGAEPIAQDHAEGEARPDCSALGAAARTWGSVRKVMRKHECFTSKRG